MLKYFKGLAIVAILAFPLTTGAAPGFRAITDIQFTALDGTSFSAEDMTGPASTNAIEIEGFAWVTLYLSAAAVSGTADVTVNCSVGPSSTDVNYPVQSESVAAGASTFSDYVPTKSVTTSKKWPVTINVANHKYLICTFTCTSGTINITNIYGGH